MSHTIAHHCDFSPGSPPLCKQQGSGGLPSQVCLYGSRPIRSSFWAFLLPPPRREPTHCEWWRGLKKWPNVWLQCRWRRRRGRAGGTMYGMWADHISLLCRQIKRTKRTPEDASSPSLRTAASPLSCIPRKTATPQRPLPPSGLYTARSQIVPQLFRPRYRQHQLRSSNVQSVTDRTNVPLPPYKAIRHREGERCPLPGRRSGSVKITCPNSPAFRGGALDSATTIHYSILPLACFDPHFLRIHRLNSNVRPLVCLSVRVRPSPEVGVAVAASEARSLARRVSALLL